MEYVLTLFSQQVLLISVAILALLWGISRVKGIADSLIWTTARPFVAILLGIGAAFLPGVFDGDRMGIVILKGILAGFLGSILFLAGIAKALLNRLSVKKKKAE